MEALRLQKMVDMLARSPLRRRLSIATVLSLFALAAVALLLSVPGAAWPTPFDPLGPAVDEEDRIPTFMNRGEAIAADVDGDGHEDLLYITSDGVVQRYAQDGSFLWSRDYRDVNDHLGIVAEESAQFFADYDWLRPHFRTQDGWALIDTDADGQKELVATMAVFMLEPVQQAGSAIVTIDLSNGTILDARSTPGIVRHVQVGDFDGDGQDDLFFVREDGPVHDVGFYTRGTGASTRAWVERVPSQEVVWEWDPGVPWGHVQAVGVGTFDGGGKDVVLTITSSQALFQSPELLPDGTTQDLVTLDGATGTVVWRQPVDLVARQLLVGDVDGDTLDDVVVQIQEPQGTAQSRGDARAHVEARRGFDGAPLWSLKGLLGGDPVVHDMVLLPGLPPRVSFTYTQTSVTDLVIEQSAHVALVSGVTGTLQQDLLISQEIVPVPNVVDATVQLSVPKPAAMNQYADVLFMHLATTDVDDDGDQDVFVGSARGTVALATTPGGFVTRWQDPTYVDSSLFTVIGAGDEAGIWTQGWTIPEGVDVLSKKYNTIPTYKHGRLFGFDADDGTPLPDKILMSQVHAVTRSDIDGEGTPDRVLGGVSGALFAMEGGSQKVRWVADVGPAAVLTLWTEDLDGDGRDDFLVEADRRLAAVSADGDVLWLRDIAYVDVFNSVELRETVAADLNGDGTRDLVASMPTARNNGHGQNPAKIVAVDGRTGAELWTHRLIAPLTNVFNLEVGDLEGDGGNDVVYGLRYPHVQFSSGALDGATGLPLWHVEEFPAEVGHILMEDTMVLVDADGDGGMDVVTATSNDYLRIQDGRTGATIRDIRLPSAQIEVHHLKAGNVGRDGGEGFVVFRNYEDGYRLSVHAPNGTHETDFVIPDVGFIAAAAVGDLDGDGKDEIVAGAFSGLVAVKPANAGTNESVFLGHLANRHVSELTLADTDGDGLDEIEYHTSEWNWPVQRGNFIGALVGRGKEVATVDLNGAPDRGDDTDPVPEPDPVNLEPSASFLVDRTSGYPGDAFTFTSTSSDPDGNITSTVWSFGDGSTATGTTVVKTYQTPGSHTVRLLVTDDGNATDGTSGTVSVFPEDAFALSQSRSGSEASPGELVTYTLSVFNTGRSTDTYTLTLTGPEAWSAVPVGSPTVTVDGGMRHDWTVQVWVDAPILRGEIQASVVADKGGAHSKTHPVVVPLVLDAALDEGGGPYGPLDEVGGSLRLTWRDGTPLADVPIDVRQVGTDAAVTVATDADGRAAFVVPHDEAHRMPGSYTVKLDPDVAGYGTYRTLPFEVTVTG